MATLFIGRNAELSMLSQLTKKNVASLVCLLGRRRIGKSTLIQHFARDKTNKISRFIEIQGLAPTQNSSLVDQLDNFSERLSAQLQVRKVNFSSWNDAFSELAQHTRKGRCLILLDEISWMAKGDNLFASKLKAFWDTELKRNPHLILVLCGSVSSWISDNLLKNASFEGRVSLEIHLKELSLPEINNFWRANNYQLSLAEKILILSILGGVPKYLEEIVGKGSIEHSILESCFNEAGLLFNDFKRIFLEIFGRRTAGLEKIVRACLASKETPTTLAKKLKIPLNGELTADLEVLELSGFIIRDYYFNFDGKPSSLSHLRVSDNYLRFYLKQIEPLREKILKGGYKVSSLKDLKSFDSMLGLQFENLILANRTLLYPLLNLSNNQIISAAPFTQRSSTSGQQACQIDLLIHTNLDVFYLCEFKCRKKIDSSVIREVKEKERRLKIPKRSALKPVLVYAGEITSEAEDQIEDYFFKVISWDKLLEG